MRAILAALLLTLMANATAAATCRDATFEGDRFTLCSATADQDLRLFLTGPDGTPYGGFAAVNSALAAQGQTLTFAMNAGMYQPDLSPVGLYIEDGTQRARLITTDGPGNFGLLPNGVFCISDRFAVIETRVFAATKPTCRYASQSGPMLVIAGREHPRFLPSSDSLHFRNGVGVSADGMTATFVISDTRVNFDRFARFFRDVLHTPDALYFDGSISRLYAPDLNRDDLGFAIGPIVGLVSPKP